MEAMRRELFGNELLGILRVLLDLAACVACRIPRVFRPAPFALNPVRVGRACLGVGRWGLRVGNSGLGRGRWGQGE
jgi:hypothetical protein